MLYLKVMKTQDITKKDKKTLMLREFLDENPMQASQNRIYYPPMGKYVMPQQEMKSLTKMPPIDKPDLSKVLPDFLADTWARYAERQGLL